MNLKKLRKQKGFRSVKAFSEACGIPEGTLYSYELELRDMSLKNACIIADALNCSLDELAGRDISKLKPMLQRDEQELLGNFRQLDDDSKASIIQLANSLPKSIAKSDVRLAVGE